jgi:hypothetical protein
MKKKTDSAFFLFSKLNLASTPEPKNRPGKSSSLVYGPQYFQHSAEHSAGAACSGFAPSMLYPNYLIAQLTL